MKTMFSSNQPARGRERRSLPGNAAAVQRQRGPGVAPLARIAADEATLYAVASEMRGAAPGQDSRLRVMLEQHLSEMAPRIGRLAECIGGTAREYARRENPRQGRLTAPEGGEDDCDAIRALFARHRGLLSLLRDATTVRAAHFEDELTAKVLADLIAGHEEQAFKLRALLWEYRNR